MAKHKNKQQKKHKADQRRATRRAKRNPRKHPPRSQTTSSPDFTDMVRRLQPLGVSSLPAIDPAEPQRCLSPIHLDTTGRVHPDPYTELGVPRDADEATILAAWREQIVLHPPEREPERARSLLAAREQLLDPEHVIERALGTLHVPDPLAFGLPPPTAADPPDVLPPLDRLVGQLALYALLEASL